MTTNVRGLIIKAGMTLQQVAESTEVSPQAKRLAHVFDADGNEEFSQREADVFNATIISDHGEKGISLWTTYADGSKKETKVSKDKVADFKFAPKGKVSHSRVANKPGADSRNFKGIQMAKELEQSGRGRLDVEKYNDGTISEKRYRDREKGLSVYLFYERDGKTIYRTEYYVNGNGTVETYYDNGNLACISDLNKYTSQLYNEDGTLGVFRRYVPDGDDTYKQVEEKELYPNSQTVKSRWTLGGKTKTSETFYKNGKPKSYKVEENYTERYGGYATVEKEYNENGTLIRYVTRKKDKEQVEKTYYENGNLKSKTVSTWDPNHHREDDEDGGYETVGGWVEKEHKEYDEDCNALQNFFNDLF